MLAGAAQACTACRTARGNLTVSNLTGNVAVDLPVSSLSTSGSTSSVSAAPFDIQLNFINPPSPSEAAAFAAAEATWESIIVGYKEAFPNQALLSMST